MNNNFTSQVPSEAEYAKRAEPYLTNDDEAQRAFGRMLASKAMREMDLFIASEIDNGANTGRIISLIMHKAALSLEPVLYAGRATKGIQQELEDDFSDLMKNICEDLPENKSS